MRAFAQAMIVLIVLCLTVNGCSKRAWVAEHGAVAAYGEATSPAPASTPPSSYATPVSPAAPREAPIDPAAEGATALQLPGAQVAEQLPWEEVEPAGPPGADGGACAGAPCHWVQIAAPVDSFGCAALLRQADAVLTAVDTPAGGFVRHEGGLWKVQLGPFSRWEEAESARDLLRTAGFATAWLVRR
jgi:hypothetical protein